MPKAQPSSALLGAADMYMMRLFPGLHASHDRPRSSSSSSESSSQHSDDLSPTSSERLFARRFVMAMKFNPASLNKCDVTPPSLDRQHSYFTRPDGGSVDATSVLASVALRTASPRRKSNMTVNSDTSPLASPTESVRCDRRTSWEDCRQQRDGYISFPDFDQLRAEHELKDS